MKEKSTVESLKDNVSEFFKYFEKNIKNHKKMMRFAYESTVTDSERDKLNMIEKPDIEINYTTPYLSRILGEISNQTPEVAVSGSGGSGEASVLTTEVVEQHMMDIFLRYEKQDKSTVLKEQFGGGYSVFKVDTEYRNNGTFDQDIVLKKSKDPTMCFFDPMATTPGKTDGRYCGEVYPMTKDEFKRKYPKFKDEADQLGYNERAESGFAWSYKNGQKDIVVLADYYCKEMESKIIVKISTGETMLKSEYNNMKSSWSDVAPIPEIVQSRKSDFMKIRRYVFFGKSILEEEVLEYPGLNYIFIAGDAAKIYETDSGSKVRESTRSYISNAVGTQKLLNYTAQTVANFSENLMQQKYLLEERSVVKPEDWNNIQRASHLLWSSESEDGKPLPQPTPIQQQDLPASIMNTFNGMQQIMQNTLGSVDPMLGVNQSDLSGKAIENGATQNNAVAMPFVTSYMDALNAVADFIVKLIPKYYVTPMSIPVVDDEGRRSFVPINQQLDDGTPDPNGLNLNYGENDLSVTVVASYSFTLQKDKALKTMTQLMSVVPAFAELMNKKGLPVLFDNLEIRGADKLKKMANEQMEEQEKQQQNQPNPAQQQLMMKQQELQLKQQKMQMEYKAKQDELEEKKNQMARDQQLAMISLEKEVMNASVQNEKVQAEIKTANIDAAVKVANQAILHEEHLLKHNDQQHNHTIDVMNLNKQ